MCNDFRLSKIRHLQVQSLVLVILNVLYNVIIGVCVCAFTVKDHYITEQIELPVHVYTT